MLSSRSAPRPRRAVGVAAALALGTLALAACTPAVEVEAARDSANPACAPMMVALPDTLAGAALRETTTQGTAAWGSPSQVVLRCGVPVPGPSTDRCVNVNGVDWVITEGNPTYTLTTFGRTPATALVLDPNQIASSTVLAQISSAAAKIPQTTKCLGASDTLNLPQG